MCKGIYTPKISEDLIPDLYRVSKELKQPMTKTASGIIRRALRVEITADELRAFLKGKRITLDCGHKFCIHPFSNTMIVEDNGKTQCHS